MLVYSAANIGAQAPALEEEIADLPVDDPSPEQVYCTNFIIF